MPCYTPLGSGVRAESGSSRYFSCGLRVGGRWGAAEGGVPFLGPITQQFLPHGAGLTAQATFKKHSHFHRCLGKAVSGAGRPRPLRN